MADCCHVSFFSDWVELIGAVAAIGGAWIGFVQLKKSIDEANRQRRAANAQADREYRWQRANEAQRTIQRMMSDRMALNAMTMLDWDGRLFAIGKDRDGKEKREQIFWKDIPTALRLEGDRYTRKEAFIRDCFDHLFHHFEMTQQSIDLGVFEPRDIKYPFQYYISKILEDRNATQMVCFLKGYGYKNALRLLKTIPISDDQHDVNLYNRNMPSRDGEEEAYG